MKAKQKAGKIYPLYRFKGIIDKFENYHEFTDYYSKKLEQIEPLLEKIKNNPKKRDIRKTKLSEEELELANLMVEFKNMMEKQFTGSMGFHVFPQKWQSTKDFIPCIETEMKFYLNAGKDTYKVAQMFQQKCEDGNLNYYFKVVHGDNDEYKRTDKMCIYTDFRTANDFIKIIREIRRENPGIKFDNLPLLTGKIDDFIGVGTDYITKLSYNLDMSQVCMEVLDKMFKGVPKAKIGAYIQKNPGIVKQIRAELIAKARALGLSEEKICVGKDFKSKMESIEAKNGNAIKTTKTYDQHRAIPQQSKKNVQSQSTNNITTESLSIPSRDTGQNSYKPKQNQGDKSNTELSDFVIKFLDSYKRLETDAQYDERLKCEECDLLLVGKHLYEYHGNNLKQNNFPGIEMSGYMTDEYGRTVGIDFSKENIEGIARLLIAANNLTVGNRKNLRDFCETSEIQNILTQMQNSPAVQQMIRNANIAKEQNAKGRGAERGPTPAEQDMLLARQYLRNCDNPDNVLSYMDTDFNIGNRFCDTSEEVPLAKIILRQQCKTPSDVVQTSDGYRIDYSNDFQSDKSLLDEYLSNYENQDKLINPDKIKQDTIVAGINISEINRKISELKDKLIVKDKDTDKNR